jgi:hypothetical protein
VRSSEADRQAKKQREAEARRRSRRSEELENRIFELESSISEIQEEISDSEKARDFEWMQQQANQLAEYEAQVTELYDEWMELQ